jgi:hypothetical protein
LIALEMLKGLNNLVTVDMDKQSEYIINALDFADFFLDISEDKNCQNKQK